MVTCNPSVWHDPESRDIGGGVSVRRLGSRQHRPSSAYGKAAPWYNRVIMAIVIRVYSDGKVLVPEEPTELPVGHLEAELRPWGPQLSDEEIKRRLEALDRFEELSVRGLSIPNEALDRESLYDPPRGL